MCYGGRYFGIDPIPTALLHSSMAYPSLGPIDYETGYGPNVCVQFEDMANHNGFRFLERYRKDYVVFNDDIQGAAAVALAGLINSTKVTKTRLVDNKYLFFGAGANATGIASILVAAMKDEGVSEAEARSRIYMMDSKGLLVKSRYGGVAEPHKQPFVRDDMGPMDRLKDAVTAIHPSVLIAHPSIKFTLEAEPTGSLPFLDVLLNRISDLVRPVY
ncbi:unnamed protein product [Dibothriocephalus latus]|uniref:Malic enzyme NAD-binding domain-containing protein n=1 Tax=Dibothriocephalus latus TaxID=60516 RepID=A0A3P7LBJ0_DIBLA|nr:unnamed protein product [Dibothriocephalus latus]